MVFSSNVFLYFFLTFVLVGYAILHRWRKWSNLFLTFASLGFYAWGQPGFVFVMIASIAINWLLALWIDKEKQKPGKGRAKTALTLAVVMNLGLLGVFKYLTWLLDNVNSWFNLSFPVPEIVLPIGISFFTFQAMSYVIDVYRDDGKVQKNFFNVCLYVSFFPQLIAGPIVRYQTVANEIEGRVENREDFVAGVHRFLVGFCKKILLANNLGLLVDTFFGLDRANLSVGGAWIAAAAYLMQVYYDFSGYSDMAIGLGRMFGFHFLENFRYPFIAKSVGGFWRRWHISMTSWFQDYLYIPLGGSRVKTPRLLFNMFMVWFCTGLWHGAAWTYVLWGLGFFVVLVIERFTGLGKWMEKHPVGHVYAMIMVVFFTVMIRCDNLPHAWSMYGSLLGISGAPAWNSVTGALCREYGQFFLVALIAGLPVRDFIVDKLHVNDSLVRIVGAVALVALTALAISYIAVGGYNPFIYFNF
ncbi:MAG: MBOAT family protein [Clostridia bacterium]|nr:MBOAT family protein [Clostridia bacterium]